MSGVPLSKQKLSANIEDKQVTKKDNIDRIEVERTFSLAKRKFGLGKIWTKLENTSKSSIILSIIALNLEHLLNILLCILNYMMFRRNKIKILSC